MRPTKFKKLITWLIILIIIFKGFVPTFRYEYYYSKDRSRMFTRMIWGNTWFLMDENYFTPGHYSTWWLPSTYVHPVPTGHGLWIIDLTLHDSGIFIRGSKIESKNLTDEFRLYSPSYYYEHVQVDSIEKNLKNPIKYNFNTIEGSGL